MKCPNCKSDKLIIMWEDNKNPSGYELSCTHCGFRQIISKEKFFEIKQMISTANEPTLPDHGNNPVPAAEQGVKILSQLSVTFYNSLIEKGIKPEVAERLTSVYISSMVTKASGNVKVNEEKPK